MALISLQDVSLSFGGPPLLDGVNLQIERGERVCLLGRNGAGKSSLMRLMAGELSPDEGVSIRQQGVHVALLPQEVPGELRGSSGEIVAGGVRPGGDAHPADLVEGANVEGLEPGMDWRVRQRVEKVLSRMGLDPDAPFESLSAGLKRRVLLARCQVSDPDLLLLDEPTNHMDIESIGWLEDFLLRYGGTLLFVTHDRMFLRKLATRIVELDRGRIIDWSGDYDSFLKRREAALDAEANEWARFDKKLAAEEAWIRQGIKARRTRNEGRVRVLEKMREERKARRERQGSARLRIQEAVRSGRLVVEARDVGFAYPGGASVVTDFSTVIMRGDKVGIMGPNGSGKTTLLRLLLGSLAPQAGVVRHGVRLEMAYFDQLRAQLDEDRSVLENVGEGSDTILFNGAQRHIIGYLQDFLFSPDRARSPVRILSGGERNRLLLAKLFTRPSNLLVMDEPTNDLDAETLELLEELLLDYPGTLLLVSHDRAFLNNVVTGTLVLEGEGRVGEYVGGYDDWLLQRSPEPPKLADKAPSDPHKAGRPRPPRDKRQGLTFKEQKELEALPLRIEALEEEQKQLYLSMSEPEFYRRNGLEIASAKARLDTVALELEEAYLRWEDLEAKATPGS